MNVVLLAKEMLHEHSSHGTVLGDNHQVAWRSHELFVS